MVSKSDFWILNKNGEGLEEAPPTAARNRNKPRDEKGWENTTHLIDGERGLSVGRADATDDAGVTYGHGDVGRRASGARGGQRQHQQQQRRGGRRDERPHRRHRDVATAAAAVCSPHVGRRVLVVYGRRLASVRARQPINRACGTSSSNAYSTDSKPRPAGVRPSSSAMAVRLFRPAPHQSGTACTGCPEKSFRPGSSRNSRREHWVL